MIEPNIDQENILNQKEQQELSPEQYIKARQDAMQHLQGEIEFLEIENKYQELLANIEQNKTRRVTMIAQRANFYNKQEEVDSEPAPQKEPRQERKLKTEA